MQAQLVGVRLLDGDLLFSTSTEADAPGLVYLRVGGWVPVGLSATTIYSRGGWSAPKPDVVTATQHLLPEATRRLTASPARPERPPVDTVTP